METRILDSEPILKRTAMVITYGKMVRDILVSTKKMSVMVKVFSLQLTGISSVVPIEMM